MRLNLRPGRWPRRLDPRSAAALLVALGIVGAGVATGEHLHNVNAAPRQPVNAAATEQPASPTAPPGAQGKDDPGCGLPADKLDNVLGKFSKQELKDWTRGIGFLFDKDGNPTFEIRFWSKESDANRTPDERKLNVNLAGINKVLMGGNIAYSDVETKMATYMHLKSAGTADVVARGAPAKTFTDNRQVNVDNLCLVINHQDGPCGGCLSWVPRLLNQPRNGQEPQCLTVNWRDRSQNMRWRHQDLVSIGSNYQCPWTPVGSAPSGVDPTPGGTLSGEGTKTAPPAATGRACVFLAPGGAGGAGHVGWAFRAGDDQHWYYGATQGTGSPLVLPGGDNNAWVETGSFDQVLTGFASEADFHPAGYYTQYRCKNSTAANSTTANTDAAIAQAKDARNWGYALIGGNNCMNHTYKILKAYGTDLPDPSQAILTVEWTPNVWFLKLGLPVYGGFEDTQDVPGATGGEASGNF
jgi:hypothetical protein